MAIDIKNSMVIFQFKFCRNIQRHGKTKRKAQLP